MKIKGLVIFTVLVVLTSTIAAAAPVNGEIGLYDKIVRLHVIANSDKEEDQALKLKVRDAVLAEMDGFISDDAGFEAAKQIIESNEETLLAACKRTLEENGSDHAVKIEFGVETYPEREYDGVTLPAGDYYSVRVVIGEGEGKNWWCVLFPPLCVGAAKDRGQALAAAGLTKDEVDIISDGKTGKYVIKFKILEFFRSTFKIK